MVHQLIITAQINVQQENIVQKEAQLVLIVDQENGVPKKVEVVVI